MKRAWIVAVLLALVGTSLSPVRASQIFQPRVVVAVADTGINPYHEVYHRPQFTEHPCTWVSGYDDCSIPALELSIGEYDTWEEAYRADEAVWASVEKHQWYWIPRTNIIGAVCHSTATGPDDGVTEGTECILDNHERGHGTGTTSSVLTEDPEALLLVHEGSSLALDLWSAPVVPDIQSHSWGPPAPIPTHAADPLIPGKPLECAKPPFDDETIMFLAAGNQVPFPSILDCDRAQPHIQVVGGGYPQGHWHAFSWTTFDFASWFCRPTASHTSVTGSAPRQCGTSFAAPTAAGAVSRALLEIRRREGYTGGSTPDMVSASLTREAFIDSIRAAATYTPDPDRFDIEPGAAAPPLASDAPYLFWGYGWLDSTVSDAIVACALNDKCPETDPTAATYLEAQQDLRRTTTQDAVGDGQNDAGSGTDAPDHPRDPVRIEAGRLYEGFINGRSDTDDWYAVTVSEGDEVNARAQGTYGCLDITTRDGTILAHTCQALTGFVMPAELTVTAPADGDLLLLYYNFIPQDYTFAVRISPPSA